MAYDISSWPYFYYALGDKVSPEKIKEYENRLPILRQIFIDRYGKETFDSIGEKLWELVKQVARLKDDYCLGLAFEYNHLLTFAKKEVRNGNHEREV